VNRYFASLLCIPLLAAASVSDKQAVSILLDKMIAGEELPSEILDRQRNSPEFPDLDQAIASVRGCKVRMLDRLVNGTYGVQWRCSGRKRKDQPSAMMIYVKDGQVTRITTAFVSSAY
jgi:hypothetical protein